MANKKGMKECKIATNSDLELVEYLSRQIFKITETLQRVNINNFLFTMQFLQKYRLFPH